MIVFSDACCSPNFYGYPDWNNCRLYYELHPASTCVGYQPPRIGRKNNDSFGFYSNKCIVLVFGIGDPHITTIDNGRYTCHIQGLFVFSQTTEAAGRLAQGNLNSTDISDSNAIYPDDLFYIHVRSVAIPPALPYVERTQGSASIFNRYIIGAGNYTFIITNNNGKFSKKRLEFL